MPPKKQKVIEQTVSTDFSPKLKKAKVEKSEDAAGIERSTTSAFTLEKESIRIISWNVAGLRGTLKNRPTVLQDLVNKYRPDVLCLQETKLQEVTKDTSNLLQGYSEHWAHSIVKKGYAGTVVYIRDVVSGGAKGGESKQTTLNSFFQSSESKNVQNSSAVSITENEEKLAKDYILANPRVDIGLEDSKYNGEGRTITVHFESFALVCCYVPNSGQQLERLDFRVEEWDPYMRSYLQQLREKKPVIYCGDLNCGHLDLDIHNPAAKHIPKQAGLTPRERSSFQILLDSGGFKDALRYFYPTATGQFTYWSKRANGRPFNKGLRLDYFLCSDEVTYMTYLLEFSNVTYTSAPPYHAYPYITI